MKGIQGAYGKYILKHFKRREVLTIRQVKCVMRETYDMCCKEILMASMNFVVLGLELG